MKAVIFNTQDYFPEIFGESFGFYVAHSLRQAGIKDILEFPPSKELNEIDAVSGASLNEGMLLLISSNIPFVSPDTIREIIKCHADSHDAVTAFTKDGVPLIAVVEQNGFSATTNEKSSVREWVVDADKAGLSVQNIDAGTKLFTVENPLQLNEALCILKHKVNMFHMQNGVTLMDSNSIWIAPDVLIGCGSVIGQGTILNHGTIIGKNCVIGPYSQITRSQVGNGSTVLNSVIQDSKIGNETNVGPFAYLRPDSKIGDHCKIGDFVEVKNSTVGNHSKASHLTYIGDCDVGEHVNFGCGTVVVNYSGKKKFRSTIKDGAFIGCNTNLISPVVVNENAYTAAGSTITRDVPEKALGVARAKQVNKEGWNK